MFFCVIFAELYEMQLFTVKLKLKKESTEIFHNLILKEEKLNFHGKLPAKYLMELK